MHHILKRIKRCVISGNVFFTSKARMEMINDCLTEEMIYESLLNAQDIYKIIRSRSPMRDSYPLSGTRRTVLRTAQQDQRRQRADVRRHPRHRDTGGR